MCSARLCSPIHQGLEPWKVPEKGMGWTCSSEDAHYTVLDVHARSSDSSPGSAPLLVRNFENSTYDLKICSHILKRHKVKSLKKNHLNRLGSLQNEMC